MMAPDHILDVRGKLCPIPLIMTKKKFAKIKQGEILEIVTEEFVSKENIERFGQKKKGLLGIKKEGSVFKIQIKK